MNPTGNESSPSDLMKAYTRIYLEIASQDTASASPAFQDEADLRRRALSDAKRLGNVEGLSVLEVGPGYGHLALLLEQRGARVSITDLVPHYLDRLREQVSGEVVLWDFQLPLWKNQFDLVILCDVLEHVFRPGDVLLAAFEALKPGGEIYVRAPANESLLNYAMNRGYPFEIVHLRTYTKALLKRELLASGFIRTVGPRWLRGGAYVPRNFFARKGYWRARLDRQRTSGGDSVILADIKQPERAVSQLRLVSMAVLNGSRSSRLPFLFRLSRAVTYVTSQPLEVWAKASRPPLNHQESLAGFKLSTPENR